MLHAVGMVALLHAGCEGADLRVGILGLDAFVHLSELVDPRMHLTLAVLQVPLVARDQVVLVLQDGRQVGNFALILLIGVDVLLISHELLLV